MSIVMLLILFLRGSEEEGGRTANQNPHIPGMTAVLLMIHSIGVLIIGLPLRSAYRRFSA